MSARSLESFLARLYSDSSFRQAFENDPEIVFKGQALDELEKEALRKIDRVGLRFASISYANKRAKKSGK
ncbi:MAG: hypothetical protein JNM27_14700 [Leptospirales bacterium]|nr:hypothetical protein [Leptospirales bacterium]